MAKWYWRMKMSKRKKHPKIVVKYQPLTVNYHFPENKWFSFDDYQYPKRPIFCEIITKSNKIVWGVWNSDVECFTYTDSLEIKNNQYKLSDNIVGDIYAKDVKYWRYMPQLPQEQ